MFVFYAAADAAASPRLRKTVPAVGVSMSLYYLLHISFMRFVKFDYGYNMKVLSQCNGWYTTHVRSRIVCRGCCRIEHHPDLPVRHFHLSALIQHMDAVDSRGLSMEPNQ